MKPLDIAAVQSFRLKPVEHRYSVRDTILYGLGLGLGSTPDDPVHLQFVYEQGLKTLPSQSVVLAHPGFWISEPSLQIDWIKVLHGEQAFSMTRPLAPAGTVRGEYEIVAVEDKGAGKGALMHVVKRLLDADSDELIAVVTSVYMLRGDGGHGGFGAPPPPPPPLPDAEPDCSADIRIMPQGALIYRLSGDMNPIHADPVAARRAGFSRPILHGLCSMGLATRALMQTVAGGDPDRLAEVSVRFSKPVYPGETLRTEMFQDGDTIRFRARAVERDLVVLDRGSARLT